MASAPSSSSRPHDSKEGDWGICSISHSQVAKMQTHGFLPPADLVQGRGSNGELPQSVQGRMSMLRPLLVKRRRISDPSLPPRSAGVLWPPTAQPHSCVHPAYCRLCCSMRAIPGLRGPFRFMEKTVLPRPLQSRWVNF